ncbi:MAG: sulfite reductase flavoprotein subunit alpha [Lautropia sp.]|nr:sulfite reductase flavoprotein subunit alpha [Lautropia sp.]
MISATPRLIIGFGSETGTCRALAYELASDPALEAFEPEVHELNDVPERVFKEAATLVIITSSYGDGGPPDNAYGFWERLHANDYLPDLRYAIFGVGDTNYAQFCGFPKALDSMLEDRQATSIINRVDSDLNHHDFFTQWQAVLLQVLQGDHDAGQRLNLRVVPDGENDVFAAPILERWPLSTGTDEATAWHVRLDTRGSGMRWQAGDTLFLIPENDTALLQAIADWYGNPEAAEALADKELRLLNKGLLRDLAGLSGNRELRKLLSVDRSQALNAYLRRADLLDVLQDFCEPARVPLIALQTLLPVCEPRAYSIASPGDAGHVDLCVRELRYTHNGRLHHGTATHWLLTHEGKFDIYCRPNGNFRLTRTKAPLILIGTGTGIAPLMGLLREMAAQGIDRETCLIFGEKTREHDFLYRDELLALHERGVLNTLITAFSRDGERKYYVQHAIAEHAGLLRDMLRRDAHLYLCGNAHHLETAVAHAIGAVLNSDVPATPATGTGMNRDMTPRTTADGSGAVASRTDTGTGPSAGAGDISAAGTLDHWKTLSRQGRLHLELY